MDKLINIMKSYENMKNLKIESILDDLTLELEKKNLTDTNLGNSIKSIIIKSRPFNDKSFEAAHNNYEIMFAYYALQYYEKSDEKEVISKLSVNEIMSSFTDGVYNQCEFIFNFLSAIKEQC